MRKKTFFLKGITTLALSIATFFSCTVDEELNTEEFSSTNESFVVTAGAKYYLKGSNGKYVTHNNAAKDMICDRTNPAAWEQFYLRQGTGYWYIKAVSINRYVSSENGAKDMICNRTALGAWEKFDISYHGTANGNDVVAFKSRSNNKYVSSENGTKDMTCNRGAVGAWEKFELVPVDGSTPPTVDPPSGGNLDPNKDPSQNFDLSKWKITLSSGDEKSVSELQGYQLSNQFYTSSSDGAMVFKNYPKGAGTTTSSTYSRVELREMLRGTNTSISTKGINKNNWVFSSSTSSNESAAGGVDGTLEATLKVNRVTTTGSSNTQKGRVIIGQIHASEDEPIRLYYHKQSNHSKGAIYFAHEPATGDERFINILGDYADECTSCSSAGDYEGSGSPSNGISLNEEFGYKIQVSGNMLYVSIYNSSGSRIGYKTLNMNNSGFANDWMYFKAGLYSGNKTVTSSTDYEQVSFYSLTASHN